MKQLRHGTAPRSRCVARAATRVSSTLAWFCLAAAIAASPAAAQGAASAEEAILEGDFATGVLIDAETGEVLLEKMAHEQREPASMVKMMTELLILEKIEEGGIRLTDTVTVSARASRMGGSQVYLKHNERFTVEELLMALAIHSANDAAAALAEFHSGSMEAFVDLMNMRAEDLGLENTIFRSVHGLPPDWGQEGDLSTAYDLAMLGRELTRFPEARRWAATARAPFRDGEFTLYNPNKLIGRFRGLDGIKTGHHSGAGYCVTASATRQGHRLIAVVMGCSSDESRATETSRLLTYGFNRYTQVTLVHGARQPIEEPYPVEDGAEREIALAYAGPLRVSVLREKEDLVRLEDRLPEKIMAPIQEGDEVGQAVAIVDGRVLGEVAIIATETVPRGNFLQRLLH